MSRHQYVSTRWSGMSGWTFTVFDCELVEGEHRDHRSITSGSGYPSERAARQAGQIRLQASVRPALVCAGGDDDEDEEPEPLPCPPCEGTGLIGGAPCGNCDGKAFLHPVTGDPVDPNKENLA